MIRGIILDCDGVMFESRNANLAYYNAVLAHFDEPPVQPHHHERAHLCHTAASPRVLEVLLGPERAAAGLEVAHKLDYRQFIPHMTPEPGIIECLKGLSGRFRLGVATNRGGSMEAILDHFNLRAFFEVVVTTRDVFRPKPFPDMLHVAMDRLGLLAEEVVFVGDSELDKQAAAAAGIFFVAYRSGFNGDHSVDSHWELLEYALGLS